MSLSEPVAARAPETPVAERVRAALAAETGAVRAAHPRSLEQYERAQALAARRRADELDDAVGQPVPAGRRDARRAPRWWTWTAVSTSTSPSVTPARWPGTRPAPTVAAVAQQAARGLTTMLPSPDSVAVSEELARRFGVPLWQFSLSASDANRFVLRLCRAITGRSKVLVFDQCYHGSVDETVVRLVDGRCGRGVGNLGPQVDPAVTTRVVDFNDAGGAGARAGARRRGMRARRAGADQHRDRAAGERVPGPAAGGVRRDRHPARAGRDAHLVRGAGRRDRGMGAAPRHRDPRQAGRRRRADRRVRHDRGGRRRGCSEVVVPEAADVGGVGGTLAATRCRSPLPGRPCEQVLTDEAFARMLSWASGSKPVCSGAVRCRTAVARNADRRPGRVHGRGRAPRNGAEAAAAFDPLVDAYLHLFLLNRGVLMTPFHMMALMSPATSEADVDRHTEVLRRRGADPALTLDSADRTAPDADAGR